jgi:mannose-6-phosphate isomerase-like protein (cupin superfamily)
MKKNIITLACITVVCITAVFFVSGAFGRQNQSPGYILEHEKDIAAGEPGPHKGGGPTTAHKFFKSASTSRLQFTKRILHPGSAIGYHLQKDEEIYYIAAGTGEMTMNGSTFMVQAGDAVLTLPGSSHGLKQTGKEDLVVIINYEKK